MQPCLSGGNLSPRVHSLGRHCPLTPAVLSIGIHHEDITGPVHGDTPCGMCLTATRSRWPDVRSSKKSWKGPHQHIDGVLSGSEGGRWLYFLLYSAVF